MKPIKLTSFGVLLVLSVTGFVFAGGVEPGAGGTIPDNSVLDCVYIQEHGVPSGLNPIGAPHRGIFTISNDPNNCEETECLAVNLWHAHVFLKNGNMTFLSPFTVNNLGADLCTITTDAINQALITYPAFCFAQVESYFAVQGTPLVSKIAITYRGGCDSCQPSTDILMDDIIMGEIEVQIVGSGPFLP